MVEAGAARVVEMTDRMVGAGMVGLAAVVGAQAGAVVLVAAVLGEGEVGADFSGMGVAQLVGMQLLRGLSPAASLTPCARSSRRC